MNQSELFERLLIQSSSLSLAIGPDGRPIYVSPLACDLLGLNKDSLIGKAWEETGPSTDLINLINANVKMVKESKKATTVAIGPECLAGSRTFECQISPMLDENGHPELMAITLTDITVKKEVKQASHYINQILDKLQSSNDIDNVIPRVLEDIVSAFEADISTILFRQDEHWYPKYTTGVGDTPKDNIFLEEQSTLAQLVQRRNDIYILNDSVDEGHFVKKMAQSWGIHSMVATPLHIQGEVFAILILAYRSRTDIFSNAKKDLIKKIGAVLSLAFSEDRYIWSREGDTASSKRYLEMLNVGVALLDGKDGSIKWSNAVYNSVIPSKFRGLNITNMPYYYISAEERGMQPIEVYNKVVNSGNPVAYGCLQERNQSGVLRYWQVAFIPTPSKRGVPEVLNLVIDVTEWESTHKKNVRLIHAIQEEQYRVRTLLDSLPVGVYISDSEGQILEINEMGSRIWGGRVLPRNIEEYWEYEGSWPNTGERLKVDEWPLARAVKRGETTIGEVIDYKSFDGKPGTVINSAAPIKNRHGKVIGAVEIDQDITQIKNLERSLEATKAYLEAIISQMPAGVAIAEAPSGKVTMCNSELKIMFPANVEMPSNIEAYSRFGLISPEDMNPLAASDHPLAIALRERRTVSGFQAALRKPNGEMMTILTSASPVVGKDGKIMGAVAIFTDISNQKDIEKRLEKQTRDLAKFNSDLQRFAYVTSNELRESLKSITNYLNLIEKNSS